VTHLAAKNEECSIHRFFLQNHARYRRSPVDTVSEVDRLVHDEHVCVAGKLNHAAPPARQNDDNSSIDSDVKENTLSFIPLGVSASAMGKQREDGDGEVISIREYAGTGIAA